MGNGVHNISVLCRPAGLASFSSSPAARNPGAVCLAALALAGAAAAQDAPRLLTGLTADAGPEGVALAWEVDESRVGRIAGFTCVYRTPGHLKTGVPGSVACGPDAIPAGARAHTVGGLPEYGEYLFELVALTDSGPGVSWPLRALHVRVAVTEALAGAAGPGRAVTGAGPLVETCRPAVYTPTRPWRLDEIVSAAHLTHFPRRGWQAAGDPAEIPEWPEPTPLATLIAQSGLDAEPLRRMFSVGDADAGVLTQTLADAGFTEAAARAGRSTKALLRPGANGGHELRLHSSYPFGDDYAFAPSHAVAGWANAARPALRPALWNRVDCPPEGRPNATHDVALALADDAGGGRRLTHAGYGWWAVAPVGLDAQRIVATQGGLSFGAPASAPPAAGTRWSGRLAGHLFWERRRWAVTGDVSLELVSEDGAQQLVGRGANLVLAPIDAKSLEPVAGPETRLAGLVLDTGSGPDADGAWSGPLILEAAGPTTGESPDGFPPTEAFLGDWRASVYGPEGTEAAGRLRLWTPLADGADPANDWPRQAVLVAGFGAAWTP